MDSTLTEVLEQGYTPLGRMTNGGLVLVQRNDYDPLYPSFRITVAGGSFCEAPADTSDWAVPEIRMAGHDMNMHSGETAQYKVSHGSGGGRPARERGELLIMLCDFVDEINAEMQILHAGEGVEMKARHDQWSKAEHRQGEKESLSKLIALGAHPDAGPAIAHAVSEGSGNWDTTVRLYTVAGGRAIFKGTHRTLGKARTFLAENGGGTLIRESGIKSVRAKATA